MAAVGLDRIATLVRDTGMQLSGYCRAAGLDLRHTKGMGYNPLTRRYALNRDTSVNYLLATQRPLV